MGLTDEDRRRLDELAAELAADDPQLGRALIATAFTLVEFERLLP